MVDGGNNRDIHPFNEVEPVAETLVIVNYVELDFGVELLYFLIGSEAECEGF
jgi:hypothetical protein